MKRIILTVAVLVLFSTAGQSVNDPVQPVGATRVAVINVGYVFHHYDKAIRLKKEIDDLLAPAKREAQQIIESAKGMQAAIASGDFRAASKDEYEAKLNAAKTKLEEMDKTIKAQIGKRQEDNLMVLWREVQEATRLYATKQGLQVVIGYGDPMEMRDIDGFPNVNRKMQAMDLGSSVPLFVGERVEIAEGVTELLNKRYREQKAK
jgi:Skp family chaperone for outer membrane proteins